jgi:hypothetical protein
MQALLRRLALLCIFTLQITLSAEEPVCTSSSQSNEFPIGTALAKCTSGSNEIPVACQLAEFPQYDRIQWAAARGPTYMSNDDIFGCQVLAERQAVDSVKAHVAVVRRGECTFSDKARAAQANPQNVALVIINNDNGTLPSFAIDDASITIPVVMVSWETGQQIIKHSLSTDEKDNALAISLKANSLSIPCMNRSFSEAKDSMNVPVCPVELAYSGLPMRANNDAHATADVDPTERFLGYNYHFGRLSNHIYSFVHAAAFARLLNRTLVYREDPFLRCHDLSAVTKFVKIIRADDFFANHNEERKSVQFCFHSAVTKRKYTW